MSEKQLEWTISVVTASGQRTVGSYATKRAAVQAMMALRAPKTPIGKFGRDYVYREPSQ